MGAAEFFTDDILIEILKRLPEKSLFRFKCVKKSWYDLIQTPYFIALQSDHKKNYNPRNIYLLVSSQWGNRVLYGIDPVHHLGYKSDSTHLHDLRPLLVLPSTTTRKMNPYLISCFKFGSKLYLFGLDYYFSLHDEKTSSVYMIEEKDLMGIEPGEDNTITNFKHLLTKTKNPMHGLKFQPLCFVANSKLYVLSGFSNFTETPFEVFSPVDETWHVLPTPYDDVVPGDINQLSHLVVEKEQVVYFATLNEILSFNLQTHKWAPASHHPLTISPPVTIVGEMAFGFFYNSGVDHICASKPFTRGEEVMRPYLAPDQAFLEVLSRSRFTYMTKRKAFYTDYIVGWQDSDNKQVLCIVTYGSKPTENQIACVDNKTNYVALSVFGIPGDLYTENRPVQEHYDTYADEKGEDGDVIRRYFNAKFLYTKHFIIRNSHLLTMGDIKTCFH